jgi:hypothetical protein
MRYPAQRAKPRLDLLKHPPRPAAGFGMGTARRISLTYGVAVTEYLLAALALVATVLAHQPPPPPPHCIDSCFTGFGEIFALTSGGLVLTTGLIVALVRLMRAWDYDRLPRSPLRLVRVSSGALVIGLFWGLVTLPAAPVVALVVASLLSW